MYANAYALFDRPNPVLEALPQSVNLVYDVLAASVDEQGCCSLTLSEIGATVQNCRRTVQRAIKRLSATHLITVERGVGRGRPSAYEVKAFFTAPKPKKRPVAEVVILSSRYAFAQEKVTSPPHPPIEEAREKELKTQPLTSPGAIMKRIRCVTEQHIHPSQQKPLQAVIGKMLFKEGLYNSLTSHPGIIPEILHLLKSAESSGSPPPETPQKRVYAKFRYQVNRIIRRYQSGVEDLMAGLSRRMEFSAEKGDIGRKRPQRRSFNEQPRRRSYSERGLVPTWAR